MSIALNEEEQTKIETILKEFGAEYTFSPPDRLGGITLKASFAGPMNAKYAADAISRLYSWKISDGYSDHHKGKLKLAFMPYAKPKSNPGAAGTRLPDIRADIGDMGAREILSCWLMTQPDGMSQPKVIFDVKEYKDPGVWGIILADAVGHITDSIHEILHVDKGFATEALRQTYNQELPNLPRWESHLGVGKKRLPSLNKEIKAEGVEVLTVWVSRRRAVVTFDPGLSDTPAGFKLWGALLAQITNYLADGYNRLRNVNYEQAIAGIADLFNRELAGPTSTREGGYYGGGGPLAPPTQNRRNPEEAILLQQAQAGDIDALEQLLILAAQQQNIPLSHIVDDLSYKMHSQIVSRRSQEMKQRIQDRRAGMPHPTPQRPIEDEPDWLRLREIGTRSWELRGGQRVAGSSRVRLPSDKKRK